MAIFIEGDQLYLRGMSPSDATPAYQGWMNDRAVTRYLESRFFPHSLESLREFVAAKANDRNHLFLAIVEKEGDRHIGNIKLGPMDWIHRHGDIGIIIGETDCQGKGFGSEAVRILSDYAFTHLGLHKLTAGMYGPNLASRRIFEKAGFEVEGVRKSYYFCEGAWVDGVIMGRINPRETSTPS